MKKPEGIMRLFAGGADGGVSAGFTAAFAAALAAYAVTVCAPFVFDLRYSLYSDSVLFYWIQALWDKSLFEGDPLTAFYRSKFVPYKPEALWIMLTSPFVLIAPYTYGLKVLAVLACAAAALMVRRLALAAGPARLAAAAALLFCPVFLSMDTFFGAPRVYGALVLIGFAWALEEKRFLLLPALVALCFLAYPAASAGLGLAAAAAPFFFREDFAARRLWPRYLAALAAGAAFCLVVLADTVTLKSLPQVMSSGSAFEAYKLYQMVGTPLNTGSLPDALLHFVLNINEHGRLYALFLFLLAALFGLAQLAEPGRPAFFPRSLKVLLAGCGAAFLLLYPLHPVSASRQLVFIIPLSLVFLAAEGLLTLAGEKFRAAAAAAVFAAVFAALHPWLNETVSLKKYAEIYGFLAASPVQSVAAGYPESLLPGTLPVFARRTALVYSRLDDQELLYLGGTGDLQRRRGAVLEALYCVRPGARERLAREYGVRWLLFEKQYYSGEFLARAAASGLPGEKDLPGLLAGAPAPAACYGEAAGRAVFAWGGAAEGFVLDLAAEPGPERREGPR